MKWRSFSDARYFEGICLGIFLFTVFVSVSVILVDFDSKNITELENYFFGMVAFGAAYFSVKIARRQIQQVIEADENKISRKKRVSRVSLSLTATRSNDLVKLIIKWNLNPVGPLPLQLKAFDKMVKELSEFCEFADDAEYRFIGSLLSIFQVLSSRIRENSGSTAVAYRNPSDPMHQIALMTLDGEAINWAVLSLMFDRLLLWSRDPDNSMGQLDFTRAEIERRIDDAWIVPNTVSTAPSSVGRVTRVMKKRELQGRTLPTWMTEHFARF